MKLGQRRRLELGYDILYLAPTVGYPVVTAPECFGRIPRLNQIAIKSHHETGNCLNFGEE